MSAPAVFSVSGLRQVLREQLDVEKNSQLTVAFSGGMDSHVLLHALSILADDFPFFLTAIHIDHSLQPQSSAWAEHCQRVCDELSVPLTIRRLKIELKKGDSLEAVARESRYAALAELLPECGLCLTAQHKNDQTETLLLQLLRGAGVHGLAAMPASRPFADGHLLRPLLEFSRQQLLDYAKKHSLVWVEDPSNQDNRFDRNFLRNEILPAMRRRWSGMDSSLSRTARHCASATEILDETAVSDLLLCHTAGNHFFPPCIASLNADLMSRLTPVRQVNALRYWIRVHGLSVPGDARMQSLQSLLAEQGGKGSIHWLGGVVTLDNHVLWLCRSSTETVPGDKTVRWNPSAALRIGDMRLSAVKVAGEGLALAAMDGAGLRVRFRRGGEQCRMPGDYGCKPLKTLFQDLSIPVWMRDRIPLIFLNDELVAVSSFWVHPYYCPAPDKEGLVFAVDYPAEPA